MPRQKFNIGAEYTRAFVANYTGYMRLDWSHLGNIPAGFTYNATRPAYSALEAAVGVRTERFDLSLYGHNLTNSNGILEIQEGALYGFNNVFQTRDLHAAQNDWLRSQDAFLICLRVGTSLNARSAARQGEAFGERFCGDCRAI